LNLASRYKTPICPEGAQSFNGKLRNECLNLEWFTCLKEARYVLEQWRIQYNGFRPQQPEQTTARTLAAKSVENSTSKWE
jgi:putative transposase